jgi:hypothetical protein
VIKVDSKHFVNFVFLHYCWSIPFELTERICRTEEIIIKAQDAIDFSGIQELAEEQVTIIPSSPSSSSQQQQSHLNVDHKFKTPGNTSQYPQQSYIQVRTVVQTQQQQQQQQPSQSLSQSPSYRQIQSQPQSQSLSLETSQNKPKRRISKTQALLQTLKSFAPEISSKLRDAPIEITSKVVSSIDDNGKPILKFSEMFVPTQEEEELITHISTLRKGILITFIILYIYHL